MFESRCSRFFESLAQGLDFLDLFMVSFSKIMMGILITEVFLVCCTMQFRVFVPLAGVKSLICHGFRSSTLAYTVTSTRTFCRFFFLHSLFDSARLESLFSPTIALQSSGAQSVCTNCLYYAWIMHGKVSRIARFCVS
jgi:hypothetical protein